LNLFEEADNFGSLLRPVSSPDLLERVQGTLANPSTLAPNPSLFESMTHQKVLQTLRQCNYLSRRYHVVIANPPYMGGKGMNGPLAVWLKDNYADVKSDLFSAFIVRNTELTLPKGQLGFMSPFTWMFISSYEKLRSLLINQKTITSLVQLEYSGFDGATVPICTFTVENSYHPDLKGGYIRLVDFRGAENQAPRTLEAIKNPNCGWFYSAWAVDFKKIPGSPIAYWIPESMRILFEKMPALSEIIYVTGGMTTADNDRFLRLWYEVSTDQSNLTAKNREEAKRSNKKWFPYNKGGEYRKWFGNRDYFVMWQNDGEAIIATGRAFPRSKESYFKESLTYTSTSSSYFGIRYSDPGFIFDAKGSSCFAESKDLKVGLGFLASKITSHLLKSINPTIEFQTGNISSLPFNNHVDAVEVVSELIAISRYDWNSFETSWDFTTLPLLKPTYHQPALNATYQKPRAHWREMTVEMQRLEEENNRIFIKAYELQDELTAEVPLDEITLTCNPHYRYGSGKSEDELEALLLADTMRDLVSYAIGCMFGRYSLDKPGLILANQGESLSDYLDKVAKESEDISFLPDDDAIIPVLEGKWFEDDLTARFIHFLKVTFGEAKLNENLQFLENALGKDIRQYLVKEFYKDHVRRYKKRPIYWLFSSPQGNFNTLIYLHRYQPDTCSKILNDYLRPFINKLQSQQRSLEDQIMVNGLSSSEKNKIAREIDQIKKALLDCIQYERDILYPVATKRISMDLDDGALVNYNKFGQAVAAVPGLNDAKTKKKVREFDWIDTSTILD
jgi:type II restriction/modification system DNA methylase subunit YeeA